MFPCFIGYVTVCVFVLVFYASCLLFLFVFHVSFFFSVFKLAACLFAFVWFVFVKVLCVMFLSVCVSLFGDVVWGMLFCLVVCILVLCSFVS